MNDETSAAQNLARLLLPLETGEQGDLDGLVAATEHTCYSLTQELGRLVTMVGSQALMARALRLARSQFPFLAEVRVGISPEPCLGGLSESVRGMEAAQVREGIVTLLTCVIDLLMSFIGEDLTRQLLRDMWPTTLDQTNRARREA